MKSALGTSCDQWISRSPRLLDSFDFPPRKTRLLRPGAASEVGTGARASRISATEMHIGTRRLRPRRY
jgi:hypothetical protein